MEYNYFIYFSIAAVINIFFILVAYLIKRKESTLESKIFIVAISVTTVEIIVELLMTFAVPFLEKNMFLSTCIAKGHTVLSILWTSLISLYTLAVVKGEKGPAKIGKVVFFITLFSFLIFSTIACILPVEFIYNSNHTTWLYIGGPGNAMITPTALIQNIAMLVFILGTKQLKNPKLIPVYMYALLFALSGMLHGMNPQLTIITYFQSLIILLIYITLANPDLRSLGEMTVAKEEAEKNSQAKTDFLSSMSHEIRTPLNAIVGLSEDNLTFSDQLPKDVVENCNDIMLASNTLLELVGNILDINKIEANKLEIANELYNFKEEIVNMCKVTSTRIGAKDVKFNLKIAKDVPEQLIGDCIHVKEAINNLLSNAIKYTDQGEVNLTIKCKNDYSKYICKLEIVCSDTGRGIKPELIDKLFNRFERLGADKDTKIEGTGLGLAITKSLVELMGGTIEVSSSYGKGSTFVIKLNQKIKSFDTIQISKSSEESTSEVEKEEVKETSKEEITNKVSINVEEDSKEEIEIASVDKEEVNDEPQEEMEQVSVNNKLEEENNPVEESKPQEEAKVEESPKVDDSEEELDLTKEEPVKEEEKDESLENISLDSSNESTVKDVKADYGNKRVLIVDDNYSNVKVAKRALRGFNVEIDECYDGQDCLDKINKGEKYDLILMDIMMPNLSGTKTLEKLKENPSFNTPVIALTADALAGSREKYLNQGFNEYLSKPVSKQDMKDKLDLIFGNASSVKEDKKDNYDNKDVSIKLN